MEIIKIIASEDVADGSSHKLLTGTGRLNEEIAARPLYQQVGFTSLPKSGTRHVGVLDGNQVTIIASTDTEDDRPVLSDAGDCAVYASKTVYIKIEAGGDITIDNGSGMVELKSNGQVQLNGTNLTVDP